LEIRRSLLNPIRWLPLLSLAMAASASAVIIDSGDGSGNVTAPTPDPGWSNVGTHGGVFTLVYLGSGWVLTANHVGVGDSTFGGVTYPWLPGTDVRLHNPDNSLADLVVFRLAQPYPALPTLPIATTTPTTQVIMIGNGANRGSPTTWMGIDGYNWAPGVTIRWGTNVPQGGSTFNTTLGTQVFTTWFDQNGPFHTTYEAQAAVGDSGGAVFHGSDLAGIMIAIGLYTNQPASTTLYGQPTYIADLPTYRDEIEELPEPVGGFGAGAALVVTLRRRRARR
jgi:hypothetical protein